jgi:hypothetical protein
MSEPDELVARIRGKVLARHLPKEDCRRTWHGYGTGAICVACDRPVDANDVEVECELPGGGTIRLHLACYEIWAREWPTCELG